MLLDDKVEFKKISNIDDKERALVEAFSSGKAHIDSYLKNEALEDLQYGITKTYLMFVTPKGKETYLLGFFSLTTDRVLITKKFKFILPYIASNTFLSLQPFYNIFVFFATKHYLNLYVLPLIEGLFLFIASNRYQKSAYHLLHHHLPWSL